MSTSLLYVALKKKWYTGIEKQGEKTVDIKKLSSFVGEVQVPGDKSISHRALLLAALAKGTSTLYGLSSSLDVVATRHCLGELGVNFSSRGQALLVDSPGLMGFVQPKRPLNCENSGTTMRLLSGIIAGSQVSATLIGDPSLSRRPMQRVVTPLRAMGAKIQALGEGRFPPVQVSGRRLKGITYWPEVASAQVKSAILLSGLTAEGTTTVIELHPTRDHTERLLRAFGAQVQFTPGEAAVVGGSVLLPQVVEVPGDVSAAAFFVVLAAALPGSELIVRGVGLNRGRTGMLEVLASMGANVTWQVQVEHPEPVGEIRVAGGKLSAFNVGGDIVPRLIDELPVLAVAAAVAEGTSHVRDAAELRVKESDRITALLRELTKLGVRCEEHPDGFTITGGKLIGADVDTHGDHRLAMALAVAGCLAQGVTSISGHECVGVSYPSFWDTLGRLRGEEHAQISDCR